MFSHPIISQIFLKDPDKTSMITRNKRKPTLLYFSLYKLPARFASCLVTGSSLDFVTKPIWRTICTSSHFPDIFHPFSTKNINVYAMPRVSRYFKLVIDTSRCISNARLFTTCSKRGGTFTCGHMINSGKYFPPKRPFPAALQCSKLSQDSRLTRIRKTLPDEIWSIIIVGKTIALKSNRCLQCSH